MKVFSEEKQSRPIPPATQGLSRAHRLRLAFLLPLLICLLPPPLAADCQVELATGAIVTCTGVDTDGVVTGALNDSVTVEVGSEIDKSEVKTATTTMTALATAISTDGGNDQIVNNGTVKTETSLVIDPPDLIASWLGSNAPPEGFVATVSTVGMDSGTSTSGASATDTLINNGTLDIGATAGINGGDIQLDLFDVTDLDASLTARATAVGLAGTNAVAITNTGEITVTANAAILSWTGELNALDEATANTTVTPLATAIGISGGSGFATITNSGSIEATAEAGAVVASAEVNVVDLAVAGASIGSGPTHDDLGVVTNPGTPMRAEAIGIYAGNGGSEVTNANGGDITASAHSIANIDSVVLTLYDFTITSDFRANAGSIASYIDAIATGIGAGDGSDRITNNGTITAKAETDVVAVGLGVGAEGVPAGTISGYFSMFYTPADATITGTAGTARTAQSAGTRGAIGIDGGGGNDTLTNNGALTVTADSNVSSTGLSVSFPLLELSGLAKPWNDFPPAFAIAATGTSAEANAAGIVGGAGGDMIVNMAPTNAGLNITANAKSYATQASIALQSVKTPSAEPYFLNLDIALANASALAAAEATGFDGGLGNDSLTNSGPLAILADAEAYSSGGAVVVEGLKGMTGLGVSIVRTQLQTEAAAYAEGMTGGEGNDTIINTGNCTVDADALGNSLSVGISVQGEMKGIGAAGAFADLSTTSSAEALGLSGDAGDDILINSASDPKSLHVHAKAMALAESFAVKLQKESEGIEIAGSLTDASVIANSTAVGLNGGAGNDALTNFGKADILAETTTENLAVDVQVQTSVKGLGIQGSFIDGSSTGTATARGMQGAAGNDMLTNTTAASLTVRAEADVYAQLIAAHITAESKGVSLDGALTKANSTASSTATGMEGGHGGDLLINGGETAVTANSTANSLALSLTVNAEVVGLGIQAALTETSTFADATALGMTGGEGGDTLINQFGAKLTTDATAKAVSSSISASITGETAGVTLAGSLARATTTPTAAATGFAGGAGDDFLYNFGRAEISADTDSTSVAVGVTAAGVTKGVSVGASLTDTSTVATATALGMGGDDGNDTIGNYGTLQVDTHSVLSAASVSFHYGGIPIGVTAGAALAKAGTHATGSATGIEGGAGNDTISNATGSLIDVDAEATSTSTAVSITADVLGYAWTDTSTITDLRAVGIDGGAGNNTMTNLGRIEADALATGNASSYSINIGAGVSSAKTYTDVSASVYGLTSDFGNDIITNAGDISLLAQSTFNAVNVSFALAGLTMAKADNTATANVTGIDAGDGANTVLNRNGANITATAKSEATTSSSSITIGVSGVDGTSKAIAGATGIATGDGWDSIYNDGVIEAAVKVKNVSGSSSLSLAGFSNQNATLGGTAEGIVSGGGNDTIWNTGSITVGGVDAGPMVNVEALSISFLDLVSIDSAEFDARAGAFGIVAGSGDDLIVNQGVITVGSDSSMAKGKAGGYTFTAASFLDMSTTQARAETVSTGIDGGDGADTLINGANGRLDVFATSEGSATSAGAELASFFSTYLASAQTHATATGMDGGNGADIVDNFGVLNVTADTSAQATSDVYASAAFLATSATTDAIALGYGLDVGSGWNQAYNVGSIVVESTATATSTASANTDFGPNSAEATSTPIATAIGIVAGESGGGIVNDSDGSVRVFASAFGPATASADEEADATADLSATAWGIQAGAGAHVIRNFGEITVNSATGATDSTPDAQANASSVDEAQATARRKGTSTAMGIGLSDGNNDVENGGTLHVQASNVAYALAGLNDDHLDRSYAYAGAGGSALFATATGIGGGNGDNRIVNRGEIEVESILTVWATSYADTFSDPNAARAYAGGTALATGISVGNGANHIDLLGDLTVNATATATAYGSGEDYGEGYVGSADAAGVVADARGVVVGNGNNTIVNTATLHVMAQSTASSSGITDDDDDFSAAVANAQAKAYGLVTGNGNNALINFGTIDVNAEALATAASTTSNQQAFSSALAIGIQAGSGNDIVANYGTITTSQILQQGAASRGIALDTAAGDDWVVLGGHSTTTGDILLGAGDDTLMFLGSAVVEGAIDPGSGSNSLVFDGFGRLDLPFNGFENTTKQGAGTFTLASLPTMHRLDVTQGTLHLESSYAMAGDSLFRTVINSNGSHGQLAVEGTATLDGALSVTKGPGFFFNGTTFDILTADSVQDHFTSVQLPTPKKLLRFGLRQSDERVQVVTQALPFTAAASNPVEWAVSDYLDRIAHRASGDLNNILTEIQNLEDAEFSSAFRSLSPASYGALTAASLMGARYSLQSVQQRMATVRTHSLIAGSLKESEPVHLASIGPYENMRLFATEADSEMRSDHDLWASGLGQWGSQDDQPGYPGYEFNIATGTIGYDHTFPSRITLGAALSKGSVDVDLTGNAGEGTIDSLSGILYGSYFSGKGYVEGALSYGRNDYENSRFLTIGSIRRTATSEHDGDVYSAYLGGGYFVQAGDWLVGPTAALRYAYLDEEGFAERGAGSVNLVLNDRQTQSLVSELSLQATTAVKTSWGALIPEVSAGVSYDFDLDDRVITAGFEGASGTAFSIADQDTEQFGAVVGCGLTLMGDKGLSTSVQYRGEFHGDFQSHGVMGVLRFTF